VILNFLLSIVLIVAFLLKFIQECIRRCKLSFSDELVAVLWIVCIIVFWNILVYCFLTAWENAERQNSSNLDIFRLYYIVMGIYVVAITGYSFLAKR
jgi:hypothetical protein